MLLPAFTVQANTMLIVHVLTGYVINGNVMNHIICDRLFPHLPDGKQVSRGTATSTLFVTISRAFLSSTPPRTRCLPCSTWGPC